MPKLLKTPFAVDAAEGFRTDIQESTGAAPNSATYQVGFPPVTMQSIASNGMPPKGSDLNGVLYDITDNLVFLTQGGGYGFDAAYATSIGGYPLNARLRLTNGDIVKSTIDGNTNDPNVDVTGWVNTNSSDQIIDESGLSQQQWNSGVESISDLIAIPNPKNGNRVYVKGYYKATNFALAQPYKGGGQRIYVESRKNENDGFLCINGWVLVVCNGEVNPEQAGALGDLLGDDTVPIQKAISSGFNVKLLSKYIVSNLTVPTGAKITGISRGLTELQSSSDGAILSLEGNDFIELSRFTLRGSGKTSTTIQRGIDGFGASNERQVVIDQMAFQAFSDSCVKLGAQWHITFNNSEFLNSNMGIDFDYTGMPSSLAGSGNIIQDCYFGSNNIGVNNNGAWHVTLLNPIFENNTTPLFINSTALYNVIQHPWLENNTNPPEIRNAVLVIGGRDWSWNDHNITASGRASTHITQSGISQYVTSRAFNTTGSGSFNFESAIIATSSTQADNSNSALKFYSGYYGPNVSTLRDADSPIAEAKFEAARDTSGGGRAHGHFCIYTGTASGDTRTSYSKKIDIDQNGNITLGSDNAQAFGSATSRASATYSVKYMYAANIGDFYGLGSPEGVLSAGIGSTYRRTDGSTGACFYVKESGAGNTGWVAK